MAEEEVSSGAGAAASAATKAADTAKAAASAASTSVSADVQSVVDDARAGAAGMRSAAKWIAGALAGIPSVAILSTILKPPDDSAFEPWLLILGIVAAVLGAVLGVIALAKVFEPVLTEDSDLVGKFRMGRIPEAVDQTYAELLSRVRADHTNAARAATRSSDMSVRAADAEAELKAAEETFKKAEDALKGHEQDQGHQRFLASARRSLGAASRANAMAQGTAEAAARASANARAQLAASVGIRGVAFRLAATDTVKQRYSQALDAVWSSAALIALGVGFVLISTQVGSSDDSEEAKPPGPESIGLVTLRLNDRGRQVFRCPGVIALSAMRLTADEDAPTVISLPKPTCPPRKVVFRLEKEPLGTLTERATVQS